MFFRYTVIKAFGLQSQEGEGEEYGKNENSGKEDYEESSGEDNCEEGSGHEGCEEDKRYGKRSGICVWSLWTQRQGSQPLRLPWHLSSRLLRKTDEEKEIGLSNYPIKKVCTLGGELCLEGCFSRCTCLLSW
jgi:hypothetical protein